MSPITRPTHGRGRRAIACFGLRRHRRRRSPTRPPPSTVLLVAVGVWRRTSPGSGPCAGRWGSRCSGRRCAAPAAPAPRWRPALTRRRRSSSIWRMSAWVGPNVGTPAARAMPPVPTCRPRRRGRHSTRRDVMTRQSPQALGLLPHGHLAAMLAVPAPPAAGGAHRRGHQRDDVPRAVRPRRRRLPRAHNRGATPVDLSGWTFSGITLTLARRHHHRRRRLPRRRQGRRPVPGHLRLRPRRRLRRQPVQLRRDRRPQRRRRRDHRQRLLPRRRPLARQAPTAPARPWS